MTYQETLDYLFNALPMYQRIGHSAYKANLDNTLKLCEHLGNPQTSFKNIHVAGTNGKGSTSHALASVLQEAGYKVGLYTSPHLKSFTERIKINGKEIEEQGVIDFVSRNKDFLEQLQPSFFEMTVGMAFDYFARQKVDYAVIEVGLGGRLDSTNVIVPQLSVITNIGMDHVQYLGHTLPLIAAEKAGIIKAGVPVVVSETHRETQPVFEKIATERQAALYFADQNYQVQEGMVDSRDSLVTYEVRGKEGADTYQLDLLGHYQRKNLVGILQALAILKDEIPEINQDIIKRGLSRIITNTGLKGRWQKLGEHPLVYCDTGHNAEGIAMIVQQINTIPYQHLYMILGMSNDKDIFPVLSLLPKEATYFFCEAKLPRAMPAATLAEKASETGLKGRVEPDVNKALKQVLEIADKEDLVFVGGSTFVVAELENL